MKTAQVRQRPGRNTYYFKWDGRQRNFKTAAEAHAALAQLMGNTTTDEALGGVPQGISGLTAEWLVLNGTDKNRTLLADWVDFAGQEPLPLRRADILEQFVAFLRGKSYTCGWNSGTTRKGNAISTIKKKLATVTRVLTWGNAMGWVPRLPIQPKLERTPGGFKDVDAKRIAEILADLDANPDRHRVRDLVRFQLATGCRPGEAVRLLWSQVDLDKGMCVLNLHKTVDKVDKPRYLMLNDAARQVLADCRARDPLSLTVFRSRHGCWSVKGYREMLQRWYGADLTPHRFRHTRAQQILDLGGKLEDVANLLGHASVSTAAIYAHRRVDHAVASAALVAELESHARSA